MDEQVPKVRDMYRALRESGHVDILTPLMHYIYDAAVPLAQHLKRCGTPDRARVLAMSGIAAAPLDAAWHRQRRAGAFDFYGAVLDRTGPKIVPKADECITDPPKLYRQKALTPRHIDVFAREFRRTGDRLEAMARSGLSSEQVELLERKIEGLLVQNGTAPWSVCGIRQRRGIMAPARRLDGTDELFELLDETPTEGLGLLAEAWRAQGYVQRLYDADVVLVLGSASTRHAAEELLIKTSVHLHVEALDQGKYVLAVRKNEQGQKSRHSAGLRWVLAMIWLYQCLTDHPGAG